jgi:hypothetical protein
VTQTHYPLAAKRSAYGAELTALYREIDAVEMFRHEIHSRRITHEYYLVGKLLRLEMQMKHTPVGVDYKFG